jgi:hypothetical protein
VSSILTRPSKVIDMDVFDTPEFKKAFWKWFDALPRQERKRFQDYPADMAELNFYNRVYKNSIDNRDSSLY